MTAIRIRFVAHPGIFTWLVRLAQYFQFWATHAEVILPDENRLGAWFLKGGVRIEPHDYDRGAFTREQIVSLSCTEAQADLFYGFLRAQLGKPYDWRAIVFFFGSRNWQEDDSWECIELLAAALAHCGLFPQQMTARFSRITPRDLYDLLTAIGAVTESS
jgi:uncharacterized protein YycO